MRTSVYLNRYTNSICVDHGDVQSVSIVISVPCRSMQERAAKRRKEINEKPFPLVKFLVPLHSLHSTHYQDQKVNMLRKKKNLSCWSRSPEKDRITIGM